ncbi:MAG: PBSX family phage terminase large subunit [Pseudomonadota bacterium]
MATVQVKLPPKLVPVFAAPNKRYRGAYGGRGSGKTRSFAKMAAIRGYQLAMEGKSGLILCGREFMNSLDESSMSEVKAAIQSEPWLAAHYDIGEKYIRTRDRRIEFAFAGLRHNLDSIKSKARIHILWVDEAEPVSDKAWLKVIPTVREHGSEIWVTWNPERESSATHQRFRVDPPQDSVIVEMNWRDNPWFPDVLNQERLEDKRKRPDQYDHVWEGDFVKVVEGAYYADLLTQASLQGRIGNVMPDPYLPYRVFTDIGGTGARSDAFSMWVAQFVAREVRVLDYYEAVGQPFSAHLTWLRKRGYDERNTSVWLPHDGATHDRVHDVSYESAFRDAGYHVSVVPNQGKGAAAARVEALRRLFPMLWFNEATTKAGRDALGWYHEKIDERRNIGLGPEHDWSSHGADAAGLMAVCYEPPRGGEQDSFEPDNET